MDFRILGPLEVEDDGRSVELGGARQRALLAILVLRRNEVVAADRLVEDLYGGRPPPTAAKSLQAHVSRLRKTLGVGRLVTRGHGYSLETHPDEVDAVHPFALRGGQGCRECRGRCFRPPQRRGGDG